jgi:hypothetical protein
MKADVLAIDIYVLTEKDIKSPAAKERGFDIDVRSEAAKHFRRNSHPIGF